MVRLFDDDRDKVWTTTGGARDYIDEYFTFTTDIIKSMVTGPDDGYKPRKKR